MPAVNQVVTMFHDSVNFLTIRADGQGMAAISKELKVKTFPTLILFRGGKELSRIEGQERAVEKLVANIKGVLSPEDKVARAKHRHRLRLEEAIKLGLTEVEEEEVEETGQVNLDIVYPACFLVDVFSAI